MDLHLNCVSGWLRRCQCISNRWTLSVALKAVVVYPLPPFILGCSDLLAEHVHQLIFAFLQPSACRQIRRQFFVCMCVDVSVSSWSFGEDPVVGTIIQPKATGWTRRGRHVWGQRAALVKYKQASFTRLSLSSPHLSHFFTFLAVLSLTTLPSIFPPSPRDFQLTARLQTWASAGRPSASTSKTPTWNASPWRSRRRSEWLTASLHLKLVLMI